MKPVVILCILISFTSSVSAEVYRWEDANGMNFSDNSSSVPEKYREKPLAETNLPSGNTNPRVRVGMYRQNRVAADQENQAAVHQAGLEQHRQAADAKKEKQIITRNFQNTLQSLANLIKIWLMLGCSLFVIWIVTIVDIGRSKFIIPSNKTVWMLLVLLLPLFAMVPYMILGPNQKCNSVNNRGKQRPRLLVQVHPTELKS